jgi:hypothetical protein
MSSKTVKFKSDEGGLKNYKIDDSDLLNNRKNRSHTQGCFDNIEKHNKLMINHELISSKTAFLSKNNNENMYSQFESELSEIEEDTLEPEGKDTLPMNKAIKQYYNKNINTK